MCLLRNAPYPIIEPAFHCFDGAKLRQGRQILKQYNKNIDKIAVILFPYYTMYNK